MKDESSPVKQPDTATPTKPVTREPVPLPSECSVCRKPATDTLDFTGCRHEGMELGREPLCDDCLCGLIEGATRGDLAVLIFKKRGTWVPSGRKVHAFAPTAERPGGEWVEIGKRCSAGRRSLWVRWIYRMAKEQETDLEAIELRAGREGDDAFVRIERSNPQFAEIENLLSVARFAATT